jgi:hypothetical protein
VASSNPSASVEAEQVLAAVARRAIELDLLQYLHYGTNSSTSSLAAGTAGRNDATITTATTTTATSSSASSSVSGNHTSIAPLTWEQCAAKYGLKVWT